MGILRITKPAKVFEYQRTILPNKISLDLIGNEPILTFGVGVGRTISEADSVHSDAKGENPYDIAFYRGNPHVPESLEMDDVRSARAFRGELREIEERKRFLEDIGCQREKQLASKYPENFSQSSISHKLVSNEQKVRFPDSELYKMPGLIVLLGENQDKWTGTWLYFDGNGTKRLNDRYSHSYVDGLLRAMSYGFSFASRNPLHEGEFSDEKRRVLFSEVGDVALRRYSHGDEIIVRLPQELELGIPFEDTSRQILEADVANVANRLRSSAMAAQLYGLGFEIGGFDSLYGHLNRKDFKKGSIVIPQRRGIE